MPGIHTNRNVTLSMICTPSLQEAPYCSSLLGRCKLEKNGDWLQVFEPAMLQEGQLLQTLRMYTTAKPLQLSQCECLYTAHLGAAGEQRAEAECA